MTMTIELNGIASFLKPAPELGEFVWRLYDEQGNEYLPTPSELLKPFDEDQMFVLKLFDGKQRYGVAFATQFTLMEWIVRGVSNLEMENTSDVICELKLLFINTGHRCRILVIDNFRKRVDDYATIGKESEFRLSETAVAKQDQKANE